MSSTNMNIRMDPEVKRQAEMLFAEFGLNMTAAINLFLRQAIRQHAIPFEVKLNTPNEETLEAMREVEEMIRTGKGKKFHSVEELFEDLNS